MCIMYVCVAGRTVLIIAHRLSTIREADQIAVIHKGQLREVYIHTYIIFTCVSHCACLLY